MSAETPSREEVALFDALYETHHRVVYAYLLGHVGNADTAADLLQETFLRVWRHREEARQVPEERQRFWLFAIARNLVLDHRRRQTTRKRCEEALRETASSQPYGEDPSQEVIAQETANAIDAAIAALPEDLRIVLTLTLVAGMSSDEIGSNMQRPAATVRSQIARARKRIAENLKRAEAEARPVESVPGNRRYGENDGI